MLVYQRVTYVSGAPGRRRRARHLDGRRPATHPAPQPGADFGASGAGDASGLPSSLGDGWNGWDFPWGFDKKNIGVWINTYREHVGTMEFSHQQ